MRTILALTTVLLFVACAKERIEPTTASAPSAPIGYAKTTCDSLQALVDSLQIDRAKACGLILSISKHWDQANQRAQFEATDCCSYANILYHEMWTMRYYIGQAEGSEILCEPLPYDLGFFLMPPLGCEYIPLPE